LGGNSVSTDCFIPHYFVEILMSPECLVFQACMFVTVSPDESNLSETISSLEFGSNARQVQLGQAKQNIQKKAPRTPGGDNDNGD